MKKISRIVIDFIPHEDQRYDTCGDWLFDGELLRLRISKTADQRHQQLVALHELIEVLLCNARGISQEAVDAFDMGEGAKLEEPGESPLAPYHEEHMFAYAIEQLMGLEMGVDWEQYADAIEGLSPKDGGGDEEAEA